MQVKAGLRAWYSDLLFVNGRMRFISPHDAFQAAGACHRMAYIAHLHP